MCDGWQAWAGSAADDGGCRGCISRGKSNGATAVATDGARLGSVTVALRNHTRAIGRYRTTVIFTWLTKARDRQWLTSKIPVEQIVRDIVLPARTLSGVVGADALVDLQVAEPLHNTTEPSVHWPAQRWQVATVPFHVTSSNIDSAPAWLKVLPVIRL
jgi:hypothetical protein